MPIKYEVFEDQKLILAEGSGLITAIDVINHLNDLAEDNRYISPMKKLIDYRTIENISISSEEASRIAKIKNDHKKIFLNEKCAFISPLDLTYGTSRVHQALVDSSDINTAVFRNIEDAQKWLGITLELNHGNKG